jgi:hypothetical protein
MEGKALPQGALSCHAPCHPSLFPSQPRSTSIRLIYSPSELKHIHKIKTWRREAGGVMSGRNEIENRNVLSLLIVVPEEAEGEFNCLFHKNFFSKCSKVHTMKSSGQKFLP